MLKYMNFLWATLFKRAFVYTIIGVYAVVIIGLMLIFSLATKATDSQPAVSFTLYPNSFISFLAFIFSTIFMALIVIHVFKKQESEGTELLISAKPISRNSIVTGKMIVVLISLLGFSVVTFIVFLIGSLFDKVAPTDQILAFAGGIFTGQLIVGILFTSIILLAGTSLKKTGIMVISTLIPVGIFIVNASAVPILGAIAPAGPALDSSVVYSRLHQKTDGTVEVEKVYNDFDKSIEKNTNSQYGFFRYFDLWGQWSKSFNIFQQVPDDNRGAGGFYKTAHIKTRRVLDNDLATVKATDGKGNTADYIWTKNAKEVINLPQNVYKAVDQSVQDDITNLKIISTGFLSDDIANFVNSLLSVDNVAKNYLTTSPNQKIAENRLASISNIVYNTMFTFNKNDSQSWYAKHTYSTNNDSNLTLASDLTGGTNYVIITSVKPWLNAGVFALIWGGIALVLIGWSYVIYLRRDFK